MAKKNRRPAARPGATRPASRTAAAGPAARAASAAAPGAAKPKRPEVPFVARPFEGMAGEADWIALREIVPAASATVRTTPAHGSREVTVVSLLPDLLPALRRADGEVVLALQVVGTSGDASRDLAATLLQALDLEPGQALTSSELPEPGPRLQDVLEASEPFEAEVHEGFDFWIASDEEDPRVLQALERANEVIVPTVRVSVPGGIGSAFWCRMNGKEFLRLVVAEAEEDTLDALARLHARRVSALEEGVRLIGAFRTCGVLVPVWELARGTEADELEAPVAAFAERLAQALASDAPLSAEERRARSGLVARQVNLR